MLVWVAMVGCGHSARIEALEARLAETEAQVAALEARLAELEGASEDDARRDALRDELRRRREERLLAGLGEPESPMDLAERPDLTPRQALSDPSYVARLARALPHVGPEGEVDGFRLSAVRRGSLLDRVGLRNGDIVTTLDDEPLRSLPELMAAWEKVNVPDVSVVRLGLSRRGEPMTLKIPLDEVPPPAAPPGEVPVGDAPGEEAPAEGAPPAEAPAP